LAVSTGFAQHQNKLDIVFDDGIGFVGFAEKARAAIFDFIFGVGDLVPKYWSEVIETDAAAANDNVGVQGHDHVATVAFARKADIADNADQPTSRDEDPQAVAPDVIEFIVERLVVRNKTELAFVLRIFLQGPIRRGCYDEMDRFVGNPI